MLEVRGVVDAGRQHHHIRVVDADGSRRPERSQQLVTVVADRPDATGREDLWQRLRNHPTVRDDVAHAGWHAHIVFEHPPLAELVADQIDARNVDAHTVRADDASRLPVKVR